MTPLQAQIEVFVTAFDTLPFEAQQAILSRLQARITDIGNIPAHNVAALNLLHQWLADESGYDEQVWPLLKQTLEANRLSDRSLFDAATADA